MPKKLIWVNKIQIYLELCRNAAGQVPGGTRGYLKSIGFLHHNILQELKKTKTKVAIDIIKGKNF